MRRLIIAIKNATLACQHQNSSEKIMKKLLIILGITGFLAACEKAPVPVVDTLVVPEAVSNKL